MDTQEAYNALIHDYLTQRGVPETKHAAATRRILQDTQENPGSIEHVRNFLRRAVVSGENYHDIDLEARFEDPETGRMNVNVKKLNAYIDAQALYMLVERIKETPENQLTEERCRFVLSPEEISELTSDYEVSLAEEQAERAMLYAGEMP